LGAGGKRDVVARLHGDGVLANAHLTATGKDVDTLLNAGMKVVWKGRFPGLQLHVVDADRLRASGSSQAPRRDAEAPLHARSDRLDLVDVDHVRVPSRVHLYASLALDHGRTGSLTCSLRSSLSKTLRMRAGPRSWPMTSGSASGRSRQ